MTLMYPRISAIHPLRTRSTFSPIRRSAPIAWSGARTMKAGRPLADVGASRIRCSGGRLKIESKEPMMASAPSKDRGSGGIAVLASAARRRARAVASARSHASRYR